MPDLDPHIQRLLQQDFPPRGANDNGVNAYDPRRRESRQSIY